MSPLSAPCTINFIMCPIHTFCGFSLLSLPLFVVASQDFFFFSVSVASYLFVDFFSIPFRSLFLALSRNYFQFEFCEA